MAATSKATEVPGLRQSYGDQVVLDGIDLSVEAGETLVILGGSGSGKSTLLRCLVGLERPEAGEVLIQGTDIFAASSEELHDLRQRLRRLRTYLP